jgi:hypothetical protein
MDQNQAAFLWFKSVQRKQIMKKNQHQKWGYRKPKPFETKMVGQTIFSLGVPSLHCSAREKLKTDCVGKESRSQTRFEYSLNFENKCKAFFKRYLNDRALNTLIVSFLNDTLKVGYVSSQRKFAQFGQIKFSHNFNCCSYYSHKN